MDKYDIQLRYLPYNPPKFNSWWKYMLHFIYPQDKKWYGDFEILKDIKYILSDGTIIIVPSDYKDNLQADMVGGGFRTDLSSVPKLLTWLMPRYYKGVAGDILHDYLYHITYKADILGVYEARKLADMERYKICMEQNSDNIFKRLDNHIRHIAIRIAGANIYNKNFIRNSKILGYKNNIIK